MRRPKRGPFPGIARGPGGRGYPASFVKWLFEKMGWDYEEATKRAEEDARATFTIEDQKIEPYKMPKSNIIFQEFDRSALFDEEAFNKALKEEE